MARMDASPNARTPRGSAVRVLRAAVLGTSAALAVGVFATLPAAAAEPGWTDFVAPETAPTFQATPQAILRFAPPTPAPMDPVPAPAKASTGAAQPDASSPWPLADLTSAIDANAGNDGVAPVIPTVNAFTSKAGARLIATLPDALRHSDIRSGLDSSGHPWFLDRSTAPLWLGGDTTLLAQGDGGEWRMGESEARVAGAGLGLRRLLLEDRVMVGVDGFVDDGWAPGDARCSLGAELASGPVGLGVNFYRPYESGAIDGAQQSAARGRDVRLRLQLPFVPSASATFEEAAWQAGAAWNTDPAASAPPTNRVGLDFKPMPFLSLDGTYAPADAASPQNAAVMLRVSLPLDGAIHADDAPIVESEPYRFSSLIGRILDPIAREDLVPVVDRVVE